jgi:hypothetical protein
LKVWLSSRKLMLKLINNNFTRNKFNFELSK